MRKVIYRTFYLALLLFVAVFAITSPAYAGRQHQKKVEGGRDGKTLHARASQITYDHSNNGSGSDTGSMTVASDSNWSPPPCWYAPQWTAKEFKETTENTYNTIVNDPGQPSYAKRSTAQFRKRYKDGKYKNYNLSKAGDGMWWGPVENPNEPDVLKRISCNETLPFWVENGEEPPVENAIDPEILAGLAYQQINVPDTEVQLNPEGQQTVNLATWAWLEKARFKPVSVTASVESLGISATTTATPVSLRIEPGTEDAELHPASGECPINEDGSIGTPYEPGNSGETPPCGLTYLRTSGDKPYQLQATVTWRVEWTGTGGSGGDLPDGTFESTQPITVQEIQSIVR